MHHWLRVSLQVEQGIRVMQRPYSVDRHEA